MQHQTRIAVFVPITWGTWDRLPLLSGAIERGVHRALGAECARLNVDLLAIGGIEDHVHLLLRLPATIGLSYLLKQLKGTSAHLVTHQLAPGEFFKWQGGYAAFSVSPRHLRQVADYIVNQRHHHLTDTLLPSLEPDAEELTPESFQSAQADFVAAQPPSAGTSVRRLPTPLTVMTYPKEEECPPPPPRAPT